MVENSATHFFHPRPTFHRRESCLRLYIHHVWNRDRFPAPVVLSRFNVTDPPRSSFEDTERETNKALTSISRPAVFLENELFPETNVWPELLYAAEWNEFKSSWITIPPQIVVNNSYLTINPLRTATFLLSQIFIFQLAISFYREKFEKVLNSIEISAPNFGISKVTSSLIIY